MRILITGSDGYIAENLKPLLLREGHQFVGYDIKTNPIDDISNFKGLMDHIKSCDAVIHLAAISGVNACEENPSKAIETNVIGTQKVSYICEYLDRPLVFTSSFATENPINVYGLTKKLAETMVLRNKGMVLRLSNVYGGAGYLEKKNNVIAYLVKQKKAGEKAQIHRDGSQSRDFIHIDDICRGIVLALSAKPGLYKLCTNKQTSVLELVKMIQIPFSFIDNPRAKKEEVNTLPNWLPLVELSRKTLKDEFRLVT